MLQNQSTGVVRLRNRHIVPLPASDYCSKLGNVEPVAELESTHSGATGQRRELGLQPTFSPPSHIENFTLKCERLNVF